MGQVTPRDRRRVLKRDRYDCVARGQLPGRCRGHLDMGHIIGRGMGGGDKYDTPAWLTTQCRAHNNAIESDATTREAATAVGLHISRNSTALIPTRAVVRYPDGIWYLLNDDGTKERAENEYPWLNTDRHPRATPVTDQSVHPLWT